MHRATRAAKKRIADSSSDDAVVAAAAAVVVAAVTAINVPSSLAKKNTKKKAPCQDVTHQAANVPAVVPITSVSDNETLSLMPSSLSLPSSTLTPPSSELACSKDSKKATGLPTISSDKSTDSPLPQTSKRRRSTRNTQALRLPQRNSMHYRRLDEIFFQADASTASSPSHPPSLHSQPPILHIGRFALQRVNTSPNIYVIDNFLSASELQYLQDIAANTNKFQRSYVDAVEAVATTEDTSNDSNSNATKSKSSTSSKSHYDTTHRTSTFVSFAPHQDSKCVAIETKAAELLGCYSSANGVIEPLQLVRYKKGQFFGVHHDLGDFNAETGSVDLPPKSMYAKRRIVTLFCYLNAVPAGGATHFPGLSSSSDNDNGGLRVEPVPGRAVLFCNITAAGQPDPRTIHAGEPVEQGVKYGLNIWICEE